MTKKNGEFKISERRFKQLALKSLQRLETEGTELTPIAHFKFRRNKYHLEKLLPVYIPEHDKYVAISFWYNQLSEKGRTQASGVCLDLTDMKNKANLVQTIADDSFLNIAKEENTINNLTIGQEDTPATKPRKSNNKKQNKKNKRKKKQQQNQQRNNNNNQQKQQHQQQPVKPQQVQHQQQNNVNNSPSPSRSQSPVQSQYPSLSPMSSVNNSPAMHNMSPPMPMPMPMPMPTQVYVPSKVPQNNNNNQYQPRPTPVQTQQPMISSSLSYGLNAIPQSVPQLLTTSSIGSVSSQITAPMASVPSSMAFGMNSVPNTPTSHPVSTMSTMTSVPNMNMINMNQQLQQIQHFKQSAALFAAFLPSRPAASVPQQMPMTMPLQSQPNMSLNTGYMNTSVPVSTNVANWNNYNNITPQTNYHHYNNQQFQFNQYHNH